MEPRIIGLRAFRRKLKSIWKDAKYKDAHFVVLHHGRPVFTVSPPPRGRGENRWEWIAEY